MAFDSRTTTSSSASVPVVYTSSDEDSSCSSGATTILTRNPHFNDTSVDIFPSPLAESSRINQLVVGISDRDVRQSQIKNKLTFNLFDEDLVMCRTCPTPNRGYFLRQPRSYQQNQFRLAPGNEGYDSPRSSDESSEESMENGHYINSESGYRTNTTRIAAASNQTQNYDVVNAFAELQLTPREGPTPPSEQDDRSISW